MTDTRVSIIMPAYNAERYLKTAVDSVLSQTFSAWELLIVNDASRDGTLEVARSLEELDDRIRVFDLPQNEGVASARNFALSHAKGKYIAFLDSDDVWLPEKLEKQIGFMEAESILICYAHYQRIDADGNQMGTVTTPAVVNYGKLLKSNFIGNLTGIYNAEVLGKQYFSDFKHEDYVAWLALIKRAGTAHAYPETLALYRVYSGSTSANKLRALTWQWRIYRLSESINFFQSCKLMLYYGNYALSKRR